MLATTNPQLMNLGSRIFLGFFGVAAVFSAAVVVDAHALAPKQQHIFVWTIACVISSIVVQGLSATRLTRKLLE